MSLEAELQKYRRQIATDAYPMSIGELSNLYRDGEIDIHPEFQRIFRWKDEQKTRLIESILLGIPLPSIFVAQNEKGVWDVVDGVQRLSTIFQFMGILRGEDNEQIEPFTCTEGPFLKSISGMTFDPSESSTSSLDTTQRLDFKRARIDVKIIKRESDKRTKYDLFQRLNSFGSIATEQELRNCLLVSLSKTHFEWLTELSDDATFKEVVELPSRLIEEQYHMELALRFILLRNIEEDHLSKIGNIGEYLTAEIVQFVELDSAARERESAIFKNTFRLLYDAGGSLLLRRWNSKQERPIGPFSLTAFEALALGIGHYDANPRITAAEVIAKRDELWSSPSYQAGFSTGQRADQRMRKTIPLGRTLFA
ncbi:DUF262 domain-containing protein [Amycolatopsis sp. lyj-84]|uniref:DUF262 domain-containing protein n=1 Tax=Amycolatopsis sp. lyj-84 TaxID=2789284 RepID=UPI00397AD7A1